ncbi:MAG: acyl-CoA synthetase [Dehalococcoidia bacterium]
MTLHFNLGDMFETVADALPDQEAVVCGERRLTYAQLDERATRLAHWLLANGIGQGDHIGLYLYNSTEYLEGTLAAFKIRAVPININYRYVEEELRYLFDNADLAGVIHHREFAPRIAAVIEDVPTLRTFLAVEDGSDADLALTGSAEYESALASSSPERDFAPRSADDLYILYTGGTTGMPKGVMWKHQDLFFAALMGGNPTGAPPETPEQVAENAQSSPTLTSLPAAPLMHGAAQWATLIYLYSGGKVILTPSKRFDPEMIWSLVEKEKVNSMAIVGDAMGRPLAEALTKPGASYDTSSLFVLGSGGATYSEGVKDQLRALLPNVMMLDSFGGSEGGNQGQSVPKLDRDARGPRFNADATTAVLDEDWRPLPPGTGVIGMLARRGRIPLGYYKDPEKTAKTFIEAHGERWVVAGDMAMVEADGTITLLGRGTNCINSGGEKVFPEEVEAALRSHPAVFDTLVVGVPDTRWGERVAAVVQVRPGQNVTLEDLDEHARKHISGYKVPRELHLVDEIMRQPSGKADYRWAKDVATGASTGAGGKSEA